MASTVRSSWLLNTGQTREDTRLTMVGATTPADTVKVRSGILPGSADGSARAAGFWLTNQTTMTATLQPGRGVIQGMTTQGAYPVTLPEAVVLTFADGDAQDRIDLVCLHVYDSAYDSSGQTTAALEIIKGTASATPVAPTVPTLALPLYYITVPANASAGNAGIPWSTAVQDLRVTTVASGGVLPVVNNAAAPGAYLSQLRDNNNVLQRWDGTGWISYPQGIGGIIPPGSAATPSYVGQYRDYNGRLERWNGTAWDVVFPSTSAFVYSYDAGSTTSTAWVDTLGDTPGSPFSVNFTAPTTGSVLVTVGCAVHTTADTATTGYMSAQITQGSTVIFAPSDDYAARGTGSYDNSVVCTYQVSGLTAGAACTATAYFHNTNATKTTWFDNYYMRVDPFNSNQIHIQPL